MSNPTYKKIQIVGTSNESYAQATKNGIEKASETLRNLDWFEVDELRGRIKDGKVEQFQVTLNVGFRID